MLRLRFLVTLILLVCPWVYSYGQLHFASVHGERGYAAMRGTGRLDLDNGLILSLSGGYYRMSDSEEDENGATVKAALLAEYELTDNFRLLAGASYIPKKLGFQNVGYGIGAQNTLCYRCGIFKRPHFGVYAGQVRYKVDSNLHGAPLVSRFKTVATGVSALAGGEMGRFLFQTRYDKVIKYNNKPPHDITSNWTEIPFMTAVVQGFVSDSLAARLAYRTRWITPYAVYARYRYLVRGDHAVAVAAGLALHVGLTTLTGGVEIFEPNRDENRKTYFSLSASTEF